MKFFLLLILVFISIASPAQVYYVEKMTTVEIDSLDKGKTLVLLPGGILEQHGPYLPSYSDGYLNEAMTSELATLAIKKGWKVLVFPMIPLGNSGANDIGGKFNYSGTYAIKKNTLRSIFLDLGTELGEQGFKNIFVVHMHGGPNHNYAIDQAAAYFNESYQGRMINIWNLAYDMNENFKNEKENAEDGFAIHAGMDETSIIYYLKPEFLAKKNAGASPLTASGPDSMITIARKDNWPGYFGAPGNANISHGEKTWKAWTAHVLLQADRILEGNFDLKKPSFYQAVSGIPAYSALIQDEWKWEEKLEAKQQAWLRSKGFK